MLWCYTEWLYDISCNKSKQNISGFTDYRQYANKGYNIKMWKASIRSVTMLFYLTPSHWESDQYLVVSKFCGLLSNFCFILRSTWLGFIGSFILPLITPKNDNKVNDNTSPWAKEYFLKITTANKTLLLLNGVSKY